MKALILVAGYATRLWPLTQKRPKPLLAVGEKPIIEHIIAKLKPIKPIDEIFIVSNSKFFENFRDWSEGFNQDLNISIVDDGMTELEERRGSIGDVIFTIRAKKIDSDLLIVAGDNLFNFRLEDFIKYSKKNSPSATIGLYDVGDISLAAQYGIVVLDKNSRITSFKEKPKEPKSTLAAMCLYYLPKEKLPLLEKYESEGHPLDLAGDFVSWLSKEETVYGHVFQGIWLDIGDEKSLEKAQQIVWSK